MNIDISNTLFKAELDSPVVAKNMLGKKMDEKGAEKIAKDYSSVFLTKLLHAMYEGVKPDPVFGGGKSEELYKSMMLDEYGKMLAENDSLRLQKNLQNALLKLQEA